MSSLPQPRSHPSNATSSTKRSLVALTALLLQNSMWTPLDCFHDAQGCAPYPLPLLLGKVHFPHLKIELLIAPPCGGCWRQQGLCGESPWRSAWHAVGLSKGSRASLQRPDERSLLRKKEVEMKLPRAEGPPFSWAPNGKICKKKVRVCLHAHTRRLNACAQRPNGVSR